MASCKDVEGWHVVSTVRSQKKYPDFIEYLFSLASALRLDPMLRRRHHIVDITSCSNLCSSGKSVVAQRNGK